tara:strand:- start:2696 stop:3610 length:915 start_codon:yes stop_codon:yes gene_type:complete
MNQFTKQTTAEDVTENLDLSGQTMLVTGATAGIGRETMRVLALRGAHVLATGRTKAKVTAASSDMPGTITPVALELTDLNSVDHCTRTILEAGLIPDAVICNAGIYPFGKLELVSGVEQVFFANFLGHFVLINNLLPAMQQRGTGKLVHVSSDSAYKQVPACGIDFDNLCGEGAFHAGEAYGRSKLANALFSLALAERLKGTNLTSNALHPGSIMTNISHSAPLWIKASLLLGRFFVRSVAEGAATQVYVATHPDVEQVSGRFFDTCMPADQVEQQLFAQKALAQELWDVAEAMTERVRKVAIA